MQKEEYAKEFDFTDQFFKNTKRPWLLYAGQISKAPAWDCDIHTHPEHSEIIYVTEGEGIFTVGQQEFFAKQGDLVIYNTKTPHKETASPTNPFRAYFCGIGNLAISGLAEGCLLPPFMSPILACGKYGKKIESYLSDIFQEVSSQIFGYDIICDGLVSSIVLLIYRLASSQSQQVLPTASDKSVSDKMREYIDRNYAQNLSLSDIADVLYLSPNYMATLFKKETGISPISYLIQKRISEAKYLLTYTQKSLTEISFLVGYENPSYFTAIFKKLTGTTPSKFRSQMAQSKKAKKDES